MKADKSCCLSIAKGGFAYLSQQREQLYISVCKEVVDFRHLLENSFNKIFSSWLATLAWYNCHYVWSLFGSFFPLFFSLPWSTNAEILPEAEIFPRETEEATFSSSYRRSRLLCAFFFRFSGDAFFQFLCRNKCCISTFFDLLLFLFCSIATQSCSTFYLYFGCYRSENKHGNWTKWQADQDWNSNILPQLYRKISNWLWTCVEIKSKERVYFSSFYVAWAECECWN